MRVDLTTDECRAAAHVGITRRLDAMARRRTEVHGAARDVWTVDIEAVAAEMALAKALGVFWTAGATPDRAEGDVAGIQVRHTQRADGRLILHERDSDLHRFVLVVGAMPTFRIVGSIMGRDGKQPRFWWANAPRPAFFVGQEFLAPLVAPDAANSGAVAA